MDRNEINKIKDKIAHSGWGIYDARNYRYDLDPNDHRLRRTPLDNLDTTAMLDPNAWEYLERKKPHTSSAAKRRYNAKTYSRIQVDLPKQFVAAAKAWAAAHNKSLASTVKEALTEYMESRD